MADTTVSSVYCMHPVTESAYQRAYDWYNGRVRTQAFNQFDKYFPTHFFKVRHMLESNVVLGRERLAARLRHNPYIAVIDVGCGTGAASVAMAETLLRLREEDSVDPRTIHLHCVAIDHYGPSLAIYKKIVGWLAEGLVSCGIQLSFDVCQQPIAAAYAQVEEHLRACRDSWQQPALSYVVAIESNIIDLLEQQRRKSARVGLELANLYSPLFQLLPVDRLHILTVDTKPAAIRAVVEDRLNLLTERIVEAGHTVTQSDEAFERIVISNPAPSYWRREGVETYTIPEFIVTACEGHSRDLADDSTWQTITSVENLELAWARVRNEVLRESMYDDVELRLFERDLQSNLERLHGELDAYAIRLGFMSETLPYSTPRTRIMEGRVVLHRLRKRL